MNKEDRLKILNEMTLKTKLKYAIRKILFNIVETYLIVLTGINFNLELKYLLFILFLYLGVKVIIYLKFKEFAIHFMKMYKCMISSFAIMCTLFLVCKFDFYQSLIATTIASVIMTELSKVKTKDIFTIIDDNLYHWKSTSKYQPLIDFMKFNYDDPRLIKYENYLKTNDVLKYNLYDLKFKQHKSMEDINEILQLYDNKKIINHLDSIYETLKYNLCLET